MLSRTARASHHLKASCPRAQCQRQRLLLANFHSSASVTDAQVRAVFVDSAPFDANSAKDVSRTQKARQKWDRQPASALKSSTTDGTARQTKPRMWKDFSKEYPSLRTAALRFWEPPQSIADVWAVRGALEKKYGSILEVHFLKDYEMHDRYQLTAFIIFADTESLKRILRDGEQFTAIAPRIPKKPIHEIGLEDIESFSKREDYQPGYEFTTTETSKNQRVIGGRITAAASEYCESVNDRSLFQPTSKRTMEAFLNWGGFSPLPPAKEPEPEKYVDFDLFGDPIRAKTEGTRMRAALKMCADNLTLPIPTGPAHVAGNHTAPVNPLASMGEQGKGQIQSKSARVFAGLYEKVQSSSLDRLRRDETSPQQAAEEEIIIAVDTLTDASTPTDTSTSSQASTSTPPSPPPAPKRPTQTPEERQALHSQMNAARMLTRATAPAKRKQPKPAIVASSLPSAKGQDGQPGGWLVGEPVQAEAKDVEDKGILGRIYGLFKR